VWKIRECLTSPAVGAIVVMVMTNVGLRAACGQGGGTKRTS
jgi:hypothetical protein